MIIKGKQLRLLKDDLDAAYDFSHSTPTSSDELLELERLLDEDDRVDTDYKGFLLNIFVEEKNVESNRKQREKDNEHDHSFYHEEENDPRYELFLERLKEHEKSYMLEYEENGLSVVIKYEGDSSSDRECDLEPRRKLRSAMKQKEGPSRQMPRVENRGMLYSQSTPRMEIKRLTGRRTRNKSKLEKEENAKLSTKKTVPHSTYPQSTLALKGDSSLDKDCNLPRRTLRSATKQNNEHFNKMRDVCSGDSQSTPTKEMKKLTGRSLRNMSKSEKEEDIMQLDPDYHAYSRNRKVVNVHYAYTDKDHEVVYERRAGESIREKEEHDDGSYSDVEIIDSTAFFKANKSNISNHGGSTRQSEFRHEVITALRKPFDEEEYKKLWHDIELRKREERHLDLRGGRDMSYGKQKDGKSYLDYYPDLERKLLKVQDDRPKCLNLLRGFFLWLKQPESFCPWLDDECLAIYPESD